MAEAVRKARDWGNKPGNLCYPESLAQEARKLAQGQNLKVSVWDEQEIIKEGLGLLAAVGQGSARPPRLVVVSYQGAKEADRKPVVLVGKGITFDSGGLCLKPAANMAAMKTDMSGAGNILATLSAVAELKLSLNVTAILPLAENMPDGRAVRPGGRSSLRVGPR